MENADAFETWLEANHDQRASIWLRVAKKASGIPSITTTEALDVALCFGWIDGQRRALDRTHFLQRYSRRRRQSTWSQVNVAKVGSLTAAGRMRPAGLAEVVAAQADGRWEAAYEPQRTATMPEDLAAALASNEAAATFFETLGRTDRFAVYLRLMTARSAEARAARLTTAITDLAAGRKVAF